MNETKIYVGLNDSETMIQKHDTEKNISVLKIVCQSYHVAFSFCVQRGGYFHEDGRFTQENTLVLSMIDADSTTVNEIAKDLCAFFHQESVMVTESPIKAYFVKDDIM